MRAGKTNSWRQTKLKEVCRDITVGHVGPMVHEYVEVGIPFLRSQNIEPFRLNLSGIKYINEQFHNKLKKCALSPGDVVVVRTGYPGTACVIPSSLTAANCADLVVIRPSPELDGRFLAYIFNSTWGRGRVAGNLVGVAQQHFNIGAAREMIVHLPSIATQRKIAAILSAYDDLIENNTRRVRILEEMAQALYREWFVHFRFPGHEKVKMVESALGRIPAGWGVVRLRDITTKIGSGATPHGGKESYKQGGISLFRSLNVYDNRFDTDGLAFIDENQAAELSNVVVEPRDILLNITGASVARCCMAPSYLLPARVNQHVAIVRVNFNSADPYYVLSCINSESRKKQLLAFAQGGATREALTKEKVGSFEVVLPSKTIIDQFAAPVRSMWTQREVLEQKNAVLRRTRDLLLPKLISGEVDVSELDVAMPEKENGNGSG